MTDAFLCDAIRTPFGRYGGALASVRADDLAAHPLKSLVSRYNGVDWDAVEEVSTAAPTRPASNRNVARMAPLLAGLPARVPALL